MTETATETPVTSEVTPQESLGWRAGLPDDLKQNEAFQNFKTVGEFAKHHLESTAKLADAETKLKDFIPRLPDDASDEEREVFFSELGRPETASEYEFDGEDKNAPEWTSHWKEQFHSLGLTKDQAKRLSAAWNSQLQQMVEAHNASIQAEQKDAESKLRTELGDKFDTNVELAKRMWTKYGDGEFDKAFENGNPAFRFSTIKMLLKLAHLTGEDTSPQGGTSLRSSEKSGFISYDKSPTPPKRS